MPDFDDLVFGAILGRVELVDCFPYKEVRGQQFAQGPWCWVLRDPRPLKKPIAWRGQQGLFNVPLGALPAGFRSTHR
jgi:hypothetical protein